MTQFHIVGWNNVRGWHLYFISRIVPIRALWTELSSPSWDPAYLLSEQIPYNSQTLFNTQNFLHDHNSHYINGHYPNNTSTDTNAMFCTSAQLSANCWGATTDGVIVCSLLPSLSTLVECPLFFTTLSYPYQRLLLEGTNTMSAKHRNVISCFETLNKWRFPRSLNRDSWCLDVWSARYVQAFRRGVHV